MNYKGYTVFEDGSVLGRRGKPVKPFPVSKNASKKGYLALRYLEDNKNKNFMIHRAVAELYLPNPDNKPQVNHINGDAWDNRVENLEWVTASENCYHRTKMYPEEYIEKRKHTKIKGFNTI